MRLGFNPSAKRMTRAAVGADDVIIRLNECAGFFYIGQFAIGKDDCASHINKKPSSAEDGWN